jgi:hypothetical protein
MHTWWTQTQSQTNPWYTTSRTLSPIKPIHLVPRPDLDRILIPTLLLCQLKALCATLGIQLRVASYTIQFLYGWGRSCGVLACTSIQVDKEGDEEIDEEGEGKVKEGIANVIDS